MNIEKGKKYVAMVVDRHYIGPETFIFSCDHAVIGEIDPSTGKFMDNHGNEYNAIVSEASLTSEIPYAYNCVCELNKLKSLYESSSITESLKDYEDKYRSEIYFVSRTKEGLPCLVSQSIDEWRELIYKQMENEENEHGEFKKENEEEEIKTEYENLIIDIINKKYSSRELKRIKKELLEHQEWIESSLETLDLQMEAMECHENFTSYAEKKRLKELEEIRKEEEEEEKKEKEVEEEEKEVEEEKPKKIDIDEVFNNVTKTLIAQDKPALRMIAEIVRKDLEEEEKEKGILLTGKSGSGKTLLMKSIAKYIDRPYMKVDATKLTIPGYVGKDIEEVLWDLYISCGGDLEKTEKAIIFFDEIDKKGSSKKSDVSGQGVLNTLLPFIEGTEYDACADMKNSSSKIKINTTNMTVVLGGAFTDVYKNLIVKNEIGFTGSIYDKPTYKEATKEDFVKYGGMTDEFMGRVNVIKINDLDVNDIKRILNESDKSQIKIQERIFKKLGVKITFTDECKTKIAKRAIDEGTGARGLNDTVSNVTWEAFVDAYKNEDNYEEIIITEETVDDPSNYQLVKKI